MRGRSRVACGGVSAVVAARQSGPRQSEYGFLVGRFIDQATLARASAIARHWGVHPHFELLAGYLATMGLGLLAVRRRNYRFLILQIPLMPLYWLLISAAAYRALWQFMTARFVWEKTEHGARLRAASKT